jgi:hypothetical protein
MLGYAFDVAVYVAVLSLLIGLVGKTAFWEVRNALNNRRVRRHNATFNRHAELCRRFGPAIVGETTGGRKPETSVRRREAW